MVSVPVYDITKLDWKPLGLVYGEDVSGAELQNDELLDGPYRNVL